MDILVADDFLEFIDHIEDELFDNIPRTMADHSNPMEKFFEVQFLKRYRFTKNTVKFHVLPLVESVETQRSTRRGLPIPMILKLTTALRFYATGSFQVVCGDLSNISQPTVCRIVQEISESLARKLPNYVAFPTTTAERDQTKLDFYNMHRFPNVIGCIDGVHIPIISPGGANAEVFRNRKSWMSLNVQVVAGPELQIYDIVIRWPGSTHDSRIFHNSGVKLRLESGDLKGSFILGDSGYPQTKYLLTKVQEPATPAEHRYNTALTSTRNSVERTFGVLKRRFPCLCYELRNKLSTATRIIAACAVLHNVGRIWDPQDIPLEMTNIQWENLIIDA